MTVYVLLRFNDDGTLMNFDVFTKKERALKAYDIAKKHFKCLLQPRIIADDLYDF